METLFIPQLLKAPAQTLEIPLEEFITGLDTLTPVRGFLIISHCGTYLDISVDVETILTLTCDRCLQQYNHRLQVKTSELLWLDKNSEVIDLLPLDQDLCQENLSETLNPDGYFDPYTWLYEQLSLAMPLRQLCGKNCHPPEMPQINPSLRDSRWSALASLKNHLKE